MYFLNINKPKGITSFDVIRKLRKRLNIKQIGHSGTLDPMACGVLQIAVADATKLLDYLGSDKTYIAKIKFGYNSTTYDAEGELVKIKEPDFNISELIKTLNSFIGVTSQMPPLYSAVKINGQKLCDMARKNKEIDITIEPRNVEIYSIDLLDFTDDTALIKVFCKKGTYIRSLAFDLGKKLGCGAYIEDLKRTKAGNFTIENANSIDDEVLNEINPLDCIDTEKKELNNIEYNRVLNGNYILNNTTLKNTDILLTKDNKLVSIAKIDDNYIRPKKVFKKG